MLGDALAANGDDARCDEREPYDPLREEAGPRHGHGVAGGRHGQRGQRAEQRPQSAAMRPSGRCQARWRRKAITSGISSNAAPDASMCNLKMPGRRSIDEEQIEGERQQRGALGDGDDAGRDSEQQDQGNDGKTRSVRGEARSAATQIRPPGLLW